MDNKRNVIILLLIIILAGLIAFFLYKQNSSKREYSERTENEGFSYGKKVIKHQTAGDKTYSYSSGSKSGAGTGTVYSSGATHSAGKGSSVNLGGGGSSLSNIPAIANMTFSWDDSPYYKELLKPIPPPEKTTAEKIFDDKIKPLIDNCGFNEAMISQVNQAESHPLYTQALAYKKSGNYKSAIELLSNLAEKSDNIYLRSISLAQLTELYSLAGDEEQNKKAQAALMVMNAKLYFKAFPGTEKTFLMIQPEAKGVIQKLLAEEPKMKFTEPKKTTSKRQ